MILKRIIKEDGSISFEPIAFEDALKEEKQNLLFADEDEEDRYDDLLDDQDDEDQDEEESQELKSKTFTFNYNNDSVSNKKMGKILAILPFLDEEDLDEFVDALISNPDNFNDLSLSSIMPFLSEQQADKVFVALLEKGKIGRTTSISSIAPFLSEEALDKFVDQYINGKYQHVNVNALYPFMDSKTVKKLFVYLLSKKEA